MRAALLCIAGILHGCSTVDTQWVRPGYTAQQPGDAKRIAVVAWAPAQHPVLAKVMSKLVADRIKLKMDYLVYSAEPMQRGWSDACAEHEAVLSLRAISAVVGPDSNATEIGLEIIGELHDCRDGALLWRAVGGDTGDAGDDNLTRMTESYVTEIGPEAAMYTAPAFLILREMLASLPNPSLTDDEIIEKIELE